MESALPCVSIAWIDDAEKTMMSPRKVRAPALISNI
jgi:hypothetical protein